jgi:RNA polymerase sigma factor (sigma-70 family)
MKKDWVLTQEAFDALLEWLDTDRDAAARKYEKIRLRLVKVFVCRGCVNAEDLADETINRVVVKLPEISAGYVGEPAAYFYAVSQKIYQEHLRRERKREPDLPMETAVGQSAPDPDPLNEDIELEYECLERCLEKLPTNKRELVLEYYQQEKQAKIDHHKKLADELGIAVNALRIRAHRIRRTLEACVHGCVEQQPAH